MFCQITGSELTAAEGADSTALRLRLRLRARGRVSKNKPVFDAYVTTCDKRDVRGL